MGGRIPVILDTDIGSDIDDAVALAYLLRQPRCELVGITTVTGNVAHRSAIADAICRGAGRTDVPVHAGAPHPIFHGIGQPEVPQYAALARRPHRAAWPAGTAVEYLRTAIRARPGEITLLSIGPFTNVALLFAADPEIPSLLGGFMSMAGNFFGHPWGAEWNCRVDTVAAAAVLRAGVRDHRLVGLNVTTQCQLPVEEMRARFVPPPLDVVRELAEVWFSRNKAMTYHDPLAAVVMFEPEVCTWERGTVAGDPGPEAGATGGGATTLAPGDGPHLVAKTVDAPRLFEAYFSVFR